MPLRHGTAHFDKRLGLRSAATRQPSNADHAQALGVKCGIAVTISEGRRFRHERRALASHPPTRRRHSATLIVHSSIPTPCDPSINGWRYNAPKLELGIMVAASKLARCKRRRSRSAEAPWRGSATAAGPLSGKTLSLRKQRGRHSFRRLNGRGCSRCRRRA